MRDLLKKNRIRSEAEKMRLSWMMVSTSMIVIFLLWTWGVNKNLSGLAGYKLDVSTLPAYPVSHDADLQASLAESVQNIQESMDEDKAAWQDVGDAYIREKGLLEGNDFCSLKFASIGREGGNVMLEYGQYYKELPVIGRGLVLEAAQDKSSVTEKENKLETGIAILTDPVISAEEARKIAVRGVEDGAMQFEQSRLAIAGYEGDFFLVWQLDFIDMEGGEAMQVLVGAQRGSIVPAESFPADAAKIR